jgi:hypothetical protein
MSFSTAVVSVIRRSLNPIGVAIRLTSTARKGGFFRYSPVDIFLSHNVRQAEFLPMPRQGPISSYHENLPACHPEKPSAAFGAQLQNPRQHAPSRSSPTYLFTRSTTTCRVWPSARFNDCFGMAVTRGRISHASP